MRSGPLQLQRLLQRLFAQQAREVASKVNLDTGVLDMSHWVKVTAEAVKPLLLARWQLGMKRTAVNLAKKTMGKAFGNSRRVVLKASKPDIAFDFDLFNSRVLDAVDHWTYVLCHDTMATATGDLTTALDRLRQAMREGLPRGDAKAALAKEIRTIFADPMRAFRIATTEDSRALHGGQLMASKDSGLVESRTWLASSDACDLCQEMDGKTVGLDEPFFVDPKGGPYAVIWYPPYHPHSGSAFAL